MSVSRLTRRNGLRRIDVGDFHGLFLMTFLETCNELNWRLREKFWVIRGRQLGWPLKNITDGGNGAPEGYAHSTMTRAKISSALRTPEVYAKLTLKVPWNKGKCGGTLSLKHRSKISIALRGRCVRSSEAISQTASKLRGRKRTAEAREKMAKAQRARFAREKLCAR